ncbi:unnamed protein product [Calicophoron daubneyi]|uniref:Activator of Hsp90 ATPase AHSA1-like N-terminal domain-containing protein n=1 Tax=Calicophoron daubneyi TaxID=300641 RepID=A0AAV2T2H4_CALDB
MAKWGQGDPRWIVEERADAKNVNNWHWTEKNATQWSIDLITKLLRNLKVEDDEFDCKITDVSKCEGEAVVNNRKAKLIYLYEWRIEGDWSGHRKTGDNKTNFHGKVEVANLSEENTIDEVDVTVTCTSTSSDAEAVRKFMQTVGAKEVRSKLGSYLKQLKEEYGKNLILPTKEDVKKSNATDNKHPHSGFSHTPVHDSSRDEGQISKCPKDLTVKELTLSDEFFCTPDDLYKVLTTKELVQAFTRGEAIVDSVVDGQYCVFGGNVTGRFRTLEPGKTIQMQWRKREWPEGHHSILTILLESFEGGTRLNLTQTGVPAYDLENTTSGWRSNFFSALKQTYGYGGRMF